jgi:hypothetical protein
MIYYIQIMWVFSIFRIIAATLGSGAYSASNRNEYRSIKIMFLGIRARPVRKAYLTVICEAIFYTMGTLISHNPIGLHGLWRE